MGKGIRFKDCVGEPILIVEIFNTFLFLLIELQKPREFNRDSRHSSSSKSPNHSFDLAPAISYSGGGGRQPPPQRSKSSD